MKCVILQPSYIPWRGYFHQIYKSDVFVFYDDVQYDKHGWRNRNQIKSPQGKHWLTIPVYSKGIQSGNISLGQVKIVWERPWNRDHWKAIRQSYHRAPCFEKYADMLHGFYERRDVLLADFTIDLTIAIARELGIVNTRFIRSSELNIQGKKTDRLIAILARLGADQYISGPSAQDYIEAEKFAAAGITVEYMQYDYPEYPQLYPPFDPFVTILDLLFMAGDDALAYIIKPKE
jgi:hypothetical protein